MTPTTPITPARAALAALAAVLALPLPTRADDHHGAGRRGAPLLAAYREECGTCHVAFPPRMLPAASWQRVMAGLATHYGSDASLDAASARPIATWLAAQAATGGRRAEPPPQDRITLSEGFRREHREVPAATWTLPAVKRAANCAACHPRADLGDFDEHAVRIPR